MHGGVKVYRGAPSAARNYVEADRSRADDYYLAEGTGIAEHLTVNGEGRLAELAPLSGDAYEAWVAGLDPETREPRGRLRTDGHAVRFVEVVVNGPKSWSLAAELHPDVAAAYEAAQDRAARQIVAWLGGHATRRVGPRGAQVAVPVEKLDAAVIRHYTSRAGDPHRHLHLQVNARVFAAGNWRGLDTVAFRDSIAAINGIGHAAVACDPGFRTALAVHGYSLAPEGEITQLAEYVGPFSKRAGQIGTLLDRYESEWRAEHPDQEPGPSLRRTWDARAWAEDRPDKVVPRDGREVHQRWLDELHTLGYRDRDQPIHLPLPLAGRIDRDVTAAEVIARLGAARSAWNAGDVRGQVEQLLARTGVVAEPGVRGELAEDLTARALALCVPLRENTPEHVRALTSRHVLGVEADLAACFAARGERDVRLGGPVTDGGLDAAQRAAVAVLAGDAPLVVIEGAAGAGKTTTLAAVRDALDRQGRRLLVVTPTRRAAQVATAETGADAGSAAWFAYQHGWRWDDTGTWTRLALGDTDLATGRVYDGPSEATRLRAGDSLLVDEAGMLDQDTAHALLAIADEAGARLALVGDRRQLPAVGRGGVLELACRWAHPDAHVDLDVIHRFVRVVDGVTVPDEDYAALSLAMRAGEDPGAVFDALRVRGLVTVHTSEAERTAALADSAAADRAAGAAPAVVVDTREQAAVLNAAIRDRLVTAGTVDERRTTNTGDGQPIGAGDVVITRRNDTGLGVANRETWTVTGVHHDGRLTVTADARGDHELPVGYVREHVELGYAVTSYGAQGDTTDTAHLVLTDSTTAASAYVAMTRGRHANTVHLVAEDGDDARRQWVDAFGRDRADLGPDAARRDAEHAAAGYTAARPPADAEQLAAALDRLRATWDTQVAARASLDRAQLDAAGAKKKADWWQHCHAILGPLADQYAAAEQQACQAEDAARASRDALANAICEHHGELQHAWYADLRSAHDAMHTIEAGPGRLGLHRARVRDAHTALDAWTERWGEVLAEAGVTPEMARHPRRLLDAAAEHAVAVLYRHAQHRAATGYPDPDTLRTVADTARRDAKAAELTWRHQRTQLDRVHRVPYSDPAPDLDAATGRARSAQNRAERADEAVATASADPAISSQPDPDRLVTVARAGWRSDRDVEKARRLHQELARARADRHQQITRPSVPYQPAPARHGPSIGI